MKALLLALAGALLPAAGPARAEEEKVLNVYNWAEYIGENTVRQFERETGIQVHYDHFESNEVLLAKMTAGRSGYDIVVPSADFGRVMIDAGLVQPLDRSRLPNWHHLSPSVTSLVARLDAGNRYLVPWLGSTVAVGYNVRQVRTALGDTPVPANPFELVFNPALTRKLKGCGIAMLDSASDVFPAALMYVGKRAYSHQPADYQAAAKMLQAVRPDIAQFSFAGYVDDLARGQICVALGYGGNFAQATRLAAAAGRPQPIVAPLPPGGAPFGFDAMAIPADAPHPGNAHRWIDFILRPEVQAEITNKVMFTSPNQSARAFIRPEVLADPFAFPPDDWLLTKAQVHEVRSAETRRVMTRLFTAFKSGLH